MLTNTDIVIRLVLAVFLSSIIGWERESIKRPAGLRTHILVCVGSTLMMVVGMDAYFKYGNDPMRLSAQVISGMGFLGAGTIIKHGNSVKGLTTAASLWSTACLGIAIGYGAYLPSIIVFVCIIGTLLFLQNFDIRIKQKSKASVLTVSTVPKAGQIGKISTVIGSIGIKIGNVQVDTIDNDVVIITFLLEKMTEEQSKLLFEKISDIDDIMQIEHH